MFRALLNVNNLFKNVIYANFYKRNNLNGATSSDKMPGICLWKISVSFAFLQTMNVIVCFYATGRLPDNQSCIAKVSEVCQLRDIIITYT